MSTSNYARIRQLGKITAEHLIRENYYRTFATAQHLWYLLENTLAKSDTNHYDILTGWRLETKQIQVPTVGHAAQNLRACLMQWRETLDLNDAECDTLNLKHLGEDIAFALGRIAEKDAIMLEEKGKHYGDSWKKRGGVGAFMMLARKWDRIEVIHNKFNTTRVGGVTMGEMLLANPGSVVDDIDDLRGYLLLAEDEVARLLGLAEFDSSEPTRGYVDQDRETSPGLA